MTGTAKELSQGTRRRKKKDDERRHAANVNGKLISDLMSQLVAVIHSSTPYYSFCTCFSRISAVSSCP